MKWGWAVVLAAAVALVAAPVASAGLIYTVKQISPVHDEFHDPVVEPPFAAGGGLVCFVLGEPCEVMVAPGTGLTCESSTDPGTVRDGCTLQVAGVSLGCTETTSTFSAGSHFLTSHTYECRATAGEATYSLSCEEFFNSGGGAYDETFRCSAWPVTYEEKNASSIYTGQTTTTTLRLGDITIVCANFPAADMECSPV